jgi:hydroxylamine reductase
MFCYQCEQTAKGEGCTKIGVCGKQPDVAALQDLIVYLLKGLSQVAVAAREKGVNDPAVNAFTNEALFSTVTNVDFDTETLAECARQVAKLRDELAAKAGVAAPEGPATLQLAADLAGMVKQGEEHGVKIAADPNADVESLKQTVIYGLKGIAAYADHARVLGFEDEDIYTFIQEALADCLTTDKDLGHWVQRSLDTGRINLRTMEILDEANTETYGDPVPVSVPLGHKAGKCILVTGHDLKDLDMLLKQTEGKGITVYTHGEMLPCHGYPELKKYEHFYGHFGTAWQNQHKEFPEFPGAILFTTNCIQKPADSYKDQVFTTGRVQWPGLLHIADAPSDQAKDFGPVIEKALAMPGFAADEDKGSVMTGFAKNAVLGVADKVIEAVKSGDIKHFFLVAGCDGAKPGRNYYTEFVEKTPADTVVLTLACGKFRFFDKQLGDIGGIPRLLDIGQCNDAYSAVQIAVALAGAFDMEVNDLPLSMVLSWYEQKAVAILLTLLYLGIKDIRLGPSLPAFITPNVLNFLVENYNIKPITTPDEDLKAILAA